MKRYYDKKHNRLVYIGKASNANYWDKHWSVNFFVISNSK